MNNSLLYKYKEFLPSIFNCNNLKIISLGEGNTPLLCLDNFCHELNLELKLYVKYEGTNPTGSFKDRGMTAAITKIASDNRIKSVICASTGNTSASAAAYAARAGLESIVLIPKGKIATGKLVQAIASGCKIIQIDGNFDHAMQLVKNMSDDGEIAIVNSINPDRLQGQKTIAFEVVEQLNNQVPDYHCLPVGNAGNISAHWLGYKDLIDCEIIKRIPRLVGYQAEGAAPFMVGHPVDNPETIATAIRIGNPQSWGIANQAVQETNGWFNMVSDQEILKTQRLLAKTEGIFCEPASAASLAGLIKDYENNKIIKNSLVVCTLTGHGLKDPDVILSHYDLEKEIITISPDYKQLKKHI